MNRPVEARASSRGQSLGFGKKAGISTDAPVGFPGLGHTPQLLARTGRIPFFFIWLLLNDRPQFRRHADRRLPSKTNRHWPLIRIMYCPTLSPDNFYNLFPGLAARFYLTRRTDRRWPSSFIQLLDKS
jgi:hypothetical protein